MIEHDELAKKLTQETVDKYYKQSVKMGCHLKCLLNLDVLGFQEDMNYFKSVIHVLETENITHDFNEAKTLIWLKTLGQPIQKFLKTRKIS